MTNEIDIKEDKEVKEVKVKPNLKTKKDILRFKGQQDMSINLAHVYKMVLEGKKITFQSICFVSSGASADFVEFDSEEAALKAYEHILHVWCHDLE